MNFFKNVVGASFIVLAVAGSAIASSEAPTTATVAAPAYKAGDAQNDFGWQ